MFRPPDRFLIISAMKMIIALVLFGHHSFAQRPITDSIITQMNSEIMIGNGDLAVALADSGLKYALLEEPQSKHKWKAFFGFRKAQILLIVQGDIETAETLFTEFKIEEKNLDKDALFWWLQFINLKGDHYGYIGDFELAFDMFSLAYNSNAGLYESEKKYYHYLSKLFLKSNQLDSAIHYSHKLISSLQFHGDTLSSSYYDHLMLRAVIVAKSGNHKQANALVEAIEHNYLNYQSKKNYSTQVNFRSKIATVKGMSQDYASALQYAKEAEQAFTKSLGKDHYDYLKYLFDLSRFYYLLDQKDSTHFHMQAIPELLARNTLKRTYLLSIRGKEIFVNDKSSFRNNLLFMLDYFNNEYLDYNEKSYDYIIAIKRNTLQSFYKLKKYSQSEPDKYWQSKYTSWKKNREDYYDWLTTHESNEDSTRQLAYALEVQEKELFKKAKVNYLADQKNVSWKDVSERLPKQSVAIEFFRYKHLKTEENTYGALLVSPECDHPIFVRLCKESELKEALKYNFAETDFEYAQRAYQSGFFYNLIWKPLEPYLQNTKDCYASLSGLLYKIALDATFPEGALVRPNVHLLHSTASLIEKAPKLPSNPEALLYGGMTYSLNQVETIDSLSGINPKNVHSYHRGLNVHTWNYLKETEREVTEISTLLKKKGYHIKLNVGSVCSENTLKTDLKNSSPDILHIATHGYYPVMPDSVLSYSQTATYARSGLVMAGANSSKTSQAPIKGFGDGILSAPEITALNLSNTQLVVLSACESGKGMVSHVDEVYGLQRAFKISGAQYIIYTLWKIPDKSTKDFMVHFYKILSEGNSIEQSFILTKNHMKKTHSVYHWAGFQLIK